MFQIIFTLKQMSFVTEMAKFVASEQLFSPRLFMWLVKYARDE